MVLLLLHLYSAFNIAMCFIFSQKNIIKIWHQMTFVLYSSVHLVKTYQSISQQNKQKDINTHDVGQKGKF